MKTPGIIGGIAPESTIDYYRSIVSTYRARRADGSYPPVLIDSIDLQRMLHLVATDRGALADYLVAEIERLVRAGADFAALASNTPHVVLDEVRRRVPIPLVSIVDVTCEAAQSAGHRRLALLGTRFTMDGRFYPDVFSRAGIALVAPVVDDLTYVHDRYMTELVKGVFRPETRAEIVQIVRRMVDREHLDGVVLAGTELPLLLRGSDLVVPSLDTTQIHVESIVNHMLR